MFLRIRQLIKPETNLTGWNGKKIKIAFESGFNYECDLSSMGILWPQKDYYVNTEDCQSYFNCNNS